MKLGCLRVTTILILSVAAIASADTAAGRVAAVIDGDDLVNNRKDGLKIDWKEMFLVFESQKRNNFHIFWR